MSRVPKPWPNTGVWEYSSSAGPRSAIRPLPRVPALSDCCAISPSSGKKDERSVPIVPGSMTWITTTAGTSTGQNRFTCLGLSQSRTTRITISMRMLVRESVAMAPRPSSATAAHQYHRLVFSAR